MVRRIQAVVVVLALLIAPLALYARGAADAMRDCNGMCCLPHAHAIAMQMAKFAAAPAPPVEPASAAEPECHHEAAANIAAQPKTTAHAKQSSPATARTTSAASPVVMQCALDCALHRAPHSGNFGLLVPIAPTKPSHVAAIRTAIESQRLAPASAIAASQDFVGSPFQPPRA